MLSIKLISTLFIFDNFDHLPIKTSSRLPGGTFELLRILIAEIITNIIVHMFAIHLIHNVC